MKKNEFYIQEKQPEKDKNNENLSIIVEGWDILYQKWAKVRRDFYYDRWIYADLKFGAAIDKWRYIK